MTVSTLLNAERNLELLMNGNLFYLIKRYMDNRKHMSCIYLFFPSLLEHALHSKTITVKWIGYSETLLCLVRYFRHSCMNSFLADNILLMKKDLLISFWWYWVNDYFKVKWLHWNKRTLQLIMGKAIDEAISVVRLTMRYFIKTACIRDFDLLLQGPILM